MRRVWLWGPVVLLMALLFTASSVSDPGELPGGMSDKAAHCVAYGLLAVLVLRALSGGLSQRMTASRGVAAVVVAVLYGLSDELHQRFVPGRQGDLADLVADGIGASAGVLLLMFVLHITARRVNPTGPTST